MRKANKQSHVVLSQDDSKKPKVTKQTMKKRGLADQPTQIQAYKPNRQRVQQNWDPQMIDIMYTSMIEDYNQTARWTSEVIPSGFEAGIACSVAAGILVKIKSEYKSKLEKASILKLSKLVEALRAKHYRAG